MIPKIRTVRKMTCLEKCVRFVSLFSIFNKISNKILRLKSLSIDIPFLPTGFQQRIISFSDFDFDFRFTSTIGFKFKGRYLGPGTHRKPGVKKTDRFRPASVFFFFFVNI